MIWFIYSDNIIESGKYTEKAFKEHLECKLFNDKDLKLENNCLFFNGGLLSDYPKIAYVRSNAYEINSFLEKQGCFCIENSNTVQNVKNKFFCHELVNKLNILQPLYMKFGSFNCCKKTLGLPFVLKDNFGKGGQNVYLIHNETDYNVAVDNFPDASENKILCQEFVKNCQNEDFRLYILDGKIIKTVIRKSQKISEFRSNIFQGGTAKIVETPAMLIAPALEIFKHLNLKFGSVDFLFDGKSYWFCEANSNVSLEPLLNNGYNIYSDLIGYCKKIEGIVESDSITNFEK